MKTQYRKGSSQGKRAGRKPQKSPGRKAEFECQLPLEQEELVEMMQDALHSFAVQGVLLLAQKPPCSALENRRDWGGRFSRLSAREIRTALFRLYHGIGRTSRSLEINNDCDASNAALCCLDCPGRWRTLVRHGNGAREAVGRERGARGESPQLASPSLRQMSRPAQTEGGTQSQFVARDRARWRKWRCSEPRQRQEEPALATRASGGDASQVSSQCRRQGAAA